MRRLLAAATGYGKSSFGRVAAGFPIGEVILKNIDETSRSCTMWIHQQNDCVKNRGYGTQVQVSVKCRWILCTQTQSKRLREASMCWRRLDSERRIRMTNIFITDVIGIHVSRRRYKSCEKEPKYVICGAKLILNHILTIS